MSPINMLCTGIEERLNKGFINAFQTFSKEVLENILLFKEMF